MEGRRAVVLTLRCSHVLQGEVTVAPSGPGLALPAGNLRTALYGMGGVAVSLSHPTCQDCNLVWGEIKGTLPYMAGRVALPLVTKFPFFFLVGVCGSTRQGLPCLRLSRVTFTC